MSSCDGLLILGAPRTQGRSRRRRFLVCGAVQVMKVWPFGVALRVWRQTASCCVG